MLIGLVPLQRMRDYQGQNKSFYSPKKQTNDFQFLFDEFKEEPLWLEVKPKEMLVVLVAPNIKLKMQVLF